MVFIPICYSRLSRLKRAVILMNFPNQFVKIDDNEKRKACGMLVNQKVRKEIRRLRHADADN